MHLLGCDVTILKMKVILGSRGMKIREKIYESIKGMDARGLSILYDQIKSIEIMKSKSTRKRKVLPIERIHELINSDSSWSNMVVQDREDRL